MQGAQDGKDKNHMARILIAGGSGLIGRHLTQKLVQKGYETAWLSRRKTSSHPSFLWDHRKELLDPNAIRFAEFIINLSGHNISEGRWTNRRKQEILDSRVQSTRLIHQRVRESGKVLKGYVSASAVGFYGRATMQKILTEDDPPGNDFLAQVCCQWEQAARQFAERQTRVVCLRTGVVLSTRGGMLPKVILPVRLGLAAAFGSGRQFLPWIHLDDLCDMYIRAIENPGMAGSFNAVAPQPATCQEFMQALSKVLRRPLWLPNVPALLLKLVLGEMSTLLLEGSRISAARITASGFTFRFPDLASCLSDLLSPP
jgi:uncharacterized protein